MKVAPNIVNFNAGEFSPLMVGRTDVKTYNSACRRLRNFIPTIQGAARRRGGTRFVREVYDSAIRGWLSPFTFNSEQAYVLEWGNLTMRFFSNHGIVGAPLVIATPLFESLLTDTDGTFRIRSVQSGDVRYVAHGNMQPSKITRTGASAFTFSPVTFNGGPFDDTIDDNPVTVYASAKTGAGVTLTATANIFQPFAFLPNMLVGTLVLLEERKSDQMRAWEPGKVIIVGDTRRSDGKHYHAVTAGNTGTIRPTHSVGEKYDGDAGILWAFDDAGFGWAVITAVAVGGLTCTVTVLRNFPDATIGVGNPTTRWALQPWNQLLGYPSCATFFKERLTWAKDRRLWGSVSGDFENMQSRDESGTTTADMGYRIDITSDQANNVKWMVPSNEALLIGTGGDEQAVFPASNADPLGPGNIAARKQTEFGSRGCPSPTVGDGVVFVQKAGRQVRDMRESTESLSERWASPDLTVLAEHITKGGLIDLAYQQAPDSIVWGVRADGVLVGFTLNREQEVRGWHQHRIGGYSDDLDTQFAVVESICCIPAPAGNRDDLWMIVRRRINGVDRRYVEWMEACHEEGDDPEDGFYVDSGLTLNNIITGDLIPGANATIDGSVNVLFNSTSPVFAPADFGRLIHYRYRTVDITGKVTWNTAIAEIAQYNTVNSVQGTIRKPWPNTSVIPPNGWRMTVTSVSGLTHLYGELVDVVTDGAVHRQLIVPITGILALDWPASKVHVGLPCPAVISPMPIEPGAEEGSSGAATKRANKVGLRFHDTAGAVIGVDEGKQLDVIPAISGNTLMNEARPLFTGVKLVPFPDGYKKEMTITVVCPQPLPCTLVAIYPKMSVEGA